MKKMTVYELTVTALMAALLCVLGPLSIPIGAVPITMVNLVICLAVYLIGYRAIISTVVYLLLGAVGLPVFSGYGAGIGKLMGPTGGYIIGYVLLAAIAALAFELSHGPKAVKAFGAMGKTEKQHRFWIQFWQILITVCGMIIGTAVLYAFGTAWFVYQQQTTWIAALGVCVFPFLPFDLIKIATCTMLGKAIRLPLSKAGLLIK